MGGEENITTSDSADIELLFGVKGGGSLSGESGQLIKAQLEQIISQINLTVDVKLNQKGLEGSGKGANGIAKEIDATFEAQKKALEAQSSALQTAFKSFEKVNPSTEAESAQIQKIREQYQGWIEQVEQLKSSKQAASAEAVASLQNEGDAIKQNMAKLQGQLKNTVDATPKQLQSLITKIDTIMRQSPRAKGTDMWNSLTSMRQEISGALNGGVDKEGNPVTVSQDDYRKRVQEINDLNAKIAETWSYVKI